MMVVLGNKVKGRNLTNEFLMPRIKAEELGFERDVGLLAGEQCSAFVGANRYNLFLFCHPELVEGQSNKKRISTSIPQPFGCISFPACRQVQHLLKRRLV